MDAVGLTDDGALVVGECKFTSSPLGYDALSTLEDHAAEIRWTPESGGSPDREYGLFSRSGFAESVEAVADERDDLRLFGLTDVLDG